MQPHLSHFVVDVLRLTLWLAVLSAVFVPVERLFALRKAGLWRVEVLNDLGYYFITSLLPAVLLALPLALLATVLQWAMPASWLGWATGLPVWARLALGMTVAEIGTYWGHRWSHEVPLLWRFHALHHSSEHMDWLVNTRAHPVDMVFVRLCGIVPLSFLGLAQSPAGARPAVAIALVSTFWGFFIHANVRWRFGLLEQLVSTPAFHHWHHTRSGAINRNYAALFPWVDRLFGSLHLPREWPADYGIDTPMTPRLSRQLIDPFFGAARPGPIGITRPPEAPETTA